MIKPIPIDIIPTARANRIALLKNVLVPPDEALANFSNAAAAKINPARLTIRLPMVWNICVNNSRDLYGKFLTLLINSVIATVIPMMIAAPLPFEFLPISITAPVNVNSPAAIIPSNSNAGIYSLRSKFFILRMNAVIPINDAATAITIPTIPAILAKCLSAPATP